MELETGEHPLPPTALLPTLFLYIYLNSVHLISHCVNLSSFISSALQFLHLTVALHILDSSNKLPVTFKNQILSTDTRVTSSGSQLDAICKSMKLHLPPMETSQAFAAHLSIKKTFLHGRFTGKHGFYKSLQRGG